eukprot:11224425-Prorocentrum_lima.AAC.1
MTSSLVGSEMCIRDSSGAFAMGRATARPTSWGMAALLVFWVAQLAFALAAGELSHRPVAASFAIGSR